MADNNTNEKHIRDAIRLDRLERQLAELGNVPGELRGFVRELESFERLLHQHVGAIGHGEKPIVIDAVQIAAIADHLADTLRHEERRRSIYRILGAGSGQLFDLALRIVQIVVLAWVAAKIGGIGPPGP